MGVPEFLKRPWRPEVAGALIGLLAVLQIIVVKSPWYITGPENQFGGVALLRIKRRAPQHQGVGLLQPAVPHVCGACGGAVGV